MTGADIRAAQRALAAGGVCLLPTDTVYGLVAALDSPDGIDALYTLKGRPRSQACQVLVYDAATLAGLLDPLEPVVRAAAAALLPGPVTCLVPDPQMRFAAVAGEHAGTVGIRAPLVDPPLSALSALLVATSANDPGGTDPAEVGDVPERVRAGCAAILDAGRLPGIASAIVDLTGDAPRLVRPGADPRALAERLRAVGLAPAW